MMTKNYCSLCYEFLMAESNLLFIFNSLFSAAKCYEQATLVCKELGQLVEIADLSERACIMYQQHGNIDYYRALVY